MKYRPAEERFWEKVEKTEGCWLWRGYVHKRGRGVKSPNPLLAHLRSPGPHVRGCWALDLILGKE